MLDNLSIIIVSCDRFSDLWDANLRLLDENWPQRRLDTILVSDTQNPFFHQGVRTLFAGDGASYSGRIRHALANVATKYVLLTLDDYFLIEKVESEKIGHLLSVMDQYDVGYLRLFRYLESRAKVAGEKHLRFVSTNRTYMVNLYPSIWRVSDLQKLVADDLSAWDLEVNLTALADKFGVKCMLSYGREFKIMDVVRKGKMLRAPARYLRKRDLYHGQRPLIPLKEAIRLKLIFILKKIVPRPIAIRVKNYMKRRGHKYYSE